MQNRYSADNSLINLDVASIADKAKKIIEEPEAEQEKGKRRIRVMVFQSLDLEPISNLTDRSWQSVMVPSSKGWPKKRSQ